MIGIPDFSNMGMENYGLITFQVLDLLFDESSSTPAKQHEVYTITHEVILLYLFIIVYCSWIQNLCVVTILNLCMGKLHNFMKLLLCGILTLFCDAGSVLMTPYAYWSQHVLFSDCKYCGAWIGSSMVR
jgi:hypothetical protein